MHRVVIVKSTLEVAWRIARGFKSLPGSFRKSDESYAACRRVISAKVASPSAVNEYGACRSRPFFFTNRFRLRYCISPFIDCCGMFNLFVTSTIRNSPELQIADSTLRMRSDSTGGRGACAWQVD
jgi:hypothetical protein